MNILRLSTLSLILGIAVMTLGYVNPASAAFKPKVCPGHPSCKPVPSNQITYTAGVTAGAFKFGPVDVTLNEHETALYPDPDATLTFSRPGGVFPCDPDSGEDDDKAACAWDAVFDECPVLLGPTLVRVDNFTVDKGNWAFERAGDRTVSFNDIELPMGDPAGKIWVHLIGPEDTPIQLIPRNASGALIAGVRTILMTRFWLGGRSLKGMGPRSSCHPKGTGVPDTLNLKDGAKGNLVITATCPTGTTPPTCEPT